MMQMFLKFLIILIGLFGWIVNICQAQMTLNATGPSNAFSVTYPGNFATLPPGLSFTFFSNQSITGSTTLNVNSTGPRALVKSGNVPLSSGDIKLGQAVSVIFDGTSWQITSPNASNANAWTVLGNNSDSTANYIGTNNFEPLIFSTNGTERMRISRSGRFGFNMNPSPSAMFSIKSLGNGAILGVARSTDAGPLIELTETGGGNARIDMYNISTGNVVQIPSGPGNIFFAGGGSLGINTTAPGNTLHVQGGARITNLSISGPVFSNTLGDLFISTTTSNFWTVVGTNLQPINNTYGVNLATTFGSYLINGNRMVSSNSPNVVFLGNAGSALNSGSNNLFYGALAGSNNTSGNSNIFLGFQSGASNVTGTQNIFLGEFSGGSATGSSNLFMGQNAGRNTTSAFNNIFLGSSAGSNNITGGANIVIGALANVSLPGLANAIAIGMNSTVGGSNMMALGGIGTNAVKVGIGTGLPQNDLHVVGGARFESLTAGGAVFASSTGDLFVSTSSGANAWTISGTNIFPQNLASNIGIGLGSISTPGLVAGASRYLTLAANQTNTSGYPSFEMLSVNTSVLNSPMSRMDFINVITPFSTRSNHARIAAFTGKSVLGHGQLGFYTSNGTLNEVMRLSENAGMSIGITFAPLVPPIHGLIVQGNVGIGTSAPGTNLDVAGGVRVSSLATPGAVFSTSAGDLYVNTATGVSGSGTNGGVAFWNSTNGLTANRDEFFWNNTTYRLGIGNSTPQVALHVSSDNTGNNVNVILEASEASATRGPGISMLRARGTSTTPSAVVLDDYLGGIAANGRTATQYNLSSSISFEVDGAVSGTSVPGRIVFSTTTSSGMSTPTERMRINSNGNLGIGFTTPSARLHIKSGGNTSGSSAFIIQNAVNTLLFDIKDNGVTSIGSPATPTARVHVRGLGNTNASDAMIVENTAGTVMFNIQDDGNVGIGVNGPTSPLHVVGNGRFYDPLGTNYSVNVFSNSGSGPRIGFSDATTSLNSYMEIGAFGGDNNIDNKVRDFRIYSNATSAAGFNILAANGRVGLGILAPTQALHVVGNICYTGNSAACSDINYKTNIVTLPSVLSNINKIRGVYYFWKTKDFPLNNFDSTRQIGVIAQELEKVYPELVITNDNGYKTVDYPKLSPILLQAIKEQQVEIDSLNRLLQAQKNEIRQIKTESNQKDELIKQINKSFNTQQKQLEGIQAEMDELKKRVFGEARKP